MSSPVNREVAGKEGEYARRKERHHAAAQCASIAQERHVDVADATRAPRRGHAPLWADRRRGPASRGCPAFCCSVGSNPPTPANGRVATVRSPSAVEEILRDHHCRELFILSRSGGGASTGVGREARIKTRQPLGYSRRPCDSRRRRRRRRSPARPGDRRRDQGRWRHRDRAARSTSPGGPTSDGLKWISPRPSSRRGGNIVKTASSRRPSQQTRR